MSNARFVVREARGIYVRRSVEFPTSRGGLVLVCDVAVAQRGGDDEARMMNRAFDMRHFLLP
jgi:hypothetical protein